MATITETEEFVTFFEGDKPGTRKILRGTEAKTFTSIPIIDFTNIDSPSLEVRKALAKELYDACSNVGFFYAKGHGVPEELVAETFDYMKRFFALSDEVKMSAHLQKNPGLKGYEPMFETKLDPKSAGDTKEAFAMGDDPLEPEQNFPSHLPLPQGIIPQNIWPKDEPWFRQSIYQYYHAVFPFAKKLVRLFALALGEESENAFDDLFQFPITSVRALHYPPNAEVKDVDYVGLGAHADYSWITLIRQDGVPGLEVLNANAQWIPATPIPHAFICNVGQFLQRHTNGIFPATVHRVRNMTGEERYSAAFFLTPDPGASLAPLKSCITEEGQKYEAIPNVGDHFIRRLLRARYQHPVSVKYRDTPEEELFYNDVLIGK